VVRTLLLLATAALCSLYSGCARNPVTGERQLMLVSRAQEQQIGDEYAPEIERQLGGRIDDPQLQAYVDRVGQRIATVSDMPDQQFHYVAVNHDSVNAVALPGGYIFITRGMLQNLQDESELAAVLAHETVHVTARHSADAMSRQIGLSVLLSAVSREAGAAAALGQVAAQILELRYSRSAEIEADVFGVDYLARSGYDPAGMVRVMQMLEAQGATRPVEFLSTHPSPENRLGRIRERIAQTPTVDGFTGRTAYQQNVIGRIR
jgi:beta-barrel assembly-enhancing protease